MQCKVKVFFMKIFMVTALFMLGLLLVFFLFPMTHSGFAEWTRDFSPAEWRNAKPRSFLFTSIRAGMIESLEKRIEGSSRQEVLSLLGPSEDTTANDSCDRYSLGAGMTLINTTPIWFIVCYDLNSIVSSFRQAD
jgi:hypothetical protein